MNNSYYNAMTNEQAIKILAQMGIRREPASQAKAGGRMSYNQGMKKLLIATAILSAAILSGCSENAELANADQRITITKLGSDGCTIYRKVTAEGHDYIVATLIGHGVSVVHSESCRCKVGK